MQKSKQIKEILAVWTYGSTASTILANKCLQNIFTLTFKFWYCSGSLEWMFR